MSVRPAPLTGVVPLKAIATAKTRMAPALSPSDRALLLHRTFQRVVGALRGCDRVSDVLVVVGDDEGEEWARAASVQTVREPAEQAGLNAALRLVDEVLAAAPTLVVPADLPLVTAEDVDALLARSPGPRSVVVAPTADGGTGALLRTPGGVIEPAYGRGSATAHLRAADAAGVPSALVHLPGFALDLDRPADIALAGGWRAVTRTIGEGVTPTIGEG